MMTGHYILIGACLLVMAGHHWNTLRLLSAERAMERKRRAVLFQMLVDLGWDEKRRNECLLLIGWNWEEIAQAERDAKQ